VEAKPETDSTLRMPEDADITSPQTRPPRLQGSHSSSAPLLAVARRAQAAALRPQTAALRPQDDDDGDPFPDEDPEPPPPPPPPVSVQDLGLQFSPCLPADQAGNLVSAIRAAFGANADVRTTCLSGTQRIGIWFRPFVNEQSNQARNRGLRGLNIIGSNETFAVFVNSAMIRSRALEVWNAMPKRLDGDGKPDAGGPVHLTGFSLAFEAPDKVVTRVDGFDERPWPDVDFRLTLTDTLSASGGQLNCESASDLDVDTSWLNFLTGVFLFAFPPLGIVFLVERIIIAGIDDPDAGSGAGCSAAALIPKEVLISGGLKVVAIYNRAQAGAGGIFAGGAFLVVPRTPEVRISGPAQIAVDEGTASVTRSYRVTTEDLRGALGIRWAGDGFVQGQGQASAQIRFNLSGATPGQVVTKRVTVRVTDADNLSAEAEVMVRISITVADEDNLPPICRLKPWLPQCQEPMARLRGRGR